MPLNPWRSALTGRAAWRSALTGRAAWRSFDLLQLETAGGGEDAEPAGVANGPQPEDYACP